MSSGAGGGDGLERIRQRYPPIVTTAQVAELLDLNVRTVLQMAADGRLPASRLPGSRKVHFFLEDILDALVANRLKPGEVDVAEALEAEEEATTEGATPEPAPKAPRRRSKPQRT